MSNKKFATLVGQVALLVLEELDSASSLLKSSQIKEQLLEKSLKSNFNFQNKEYAYGLNRSSGKERWYDALNLAVSTLKFKEYKSGPHGMWEITDLGKKFLKKADERENKEKELSDFFKEFHRNSYMRKGEFSHSDESNTANADNSTQIEDEDEEVNKVSLFNEDDIRSSIFRHLEMLEPKEFQKLVGYLFEGMGYTVPYVAEEGPDGGVDIIAHKDTIGVDNKIVKIQVKHSKNVDDPGYGMKELHQLWGVCGADAFPVFVSLKGFSSDAKKRVRTDSGNFMTLIDHVRFVDLWIEHIDNIPDEGKKMFPLKKVYVIDAE